MKKFFLLFSIIFLFWNNMVFSANATIDQNIKPNIIQIPEILNLEDVKLYKKIITLQREGDWTAADKFEKKIENQILKGYLKYDKLMHPNKYRASYEELSNWLKNNKDYPVVMRKRVHNLMLKRAKTKEEKMQNKKPVFGDYLRGYGEKVNFVHGEGFSIKNKDKIKKNINNLFENKLYNKLVKYSKKENFTKEYKIKLINDNIKKIFFSGKIFESMRLYEYFNNNMDIKNRDFLLTAGINSFRVGRNKQALQYFKKCNRIKGFKNTRYEKWHISGCLYWNAKVDKKNSDNKKMLKEASLYPRTLYGQLALEKLGYNDPFRWEKEYTLDPEKFNSLMKYKSFLRVLALSKLNLYDKGDLELRNLYSQLDKKDEELLFYISEELSLAAVQMRLGEKFRNKDDTIYLRGLYPTPRWNLDAKQFIVDKALILALIRRESAFNIKAKSSKGARGLMQLMPRTASKIHNDHRLRYGHVHKLYLVKLNLNLGQRYLKQLLLQKRTSSSIPDVLIAYNAGFKRLKKWKINLKENDPLAFIESIPIRETRWFVKNILTDLWIYRDKLGQEKPSRTHLASDSWPKYKKLDYLYSRDAKLRLY